MDLFGGGIGRLNRSLFLFKRGSLALLLAVAMIVSLLLPSMQASAATYTVVKGVVTDTYDGKPMSGVTVSLYRDGYDTSLLSVTTAADGTYQLTYAFQAAYTYKLIFNKDGYFKKFQPITQYPAELVLDAGMTAVCTIEGYVTGFDVYDSWKGPVVTDQNGNYVTSPIAHDGIHGKYFVQMGPGTYTLTATKDNGAKAIRTVTIKPFETLKVDLPFEYMHSVKVTVRTHDFKAPTSPVQVELLNRDGSQVLQTVQTNSAGEYLFERLTQYEWYTVRATAGDLIKQHTFASEAELEEIYLRLPGTSVEGVVRDAQTGDVLDQAHVTAWQNGLIVSAVYASYGSYFLELPPGSYTLQAEKDGYSKQATEITLDRYEEEKQDLQLEQAYGKVTGKVVNSSQQVIRYADVTLLDKNGEVTAKTKTDTNGVYTFAEVPLHAPDYKVKVEAYPYTTHTSPWLVVKADQTTTHNVTLIGVGTLSGKIKATDGRGIEGALVTIYSGSTQMGTTTTDADGKYQFDSLLPSRYTVKVSKAAYYDASKINVPVSIGRTSYADLMMSPVLGGLSGHVVDAVDQLPMQSVKISVYDASTNRLMRTTFTNRNGDYTTSSLPLDRTYKVVASRYGYFTSTVNPVTITQQSPNTVDYVMQLAYGGIGGTVYFFDKSFTLSGANVELLDKKKHVVATTTSNADGTYLFEGLPVTNTYGVRITLDGYYKYQSSILYKSDELKTTLVDGRLRFDSSVLTGKVVTSGKAVAGASVSVYSSMGTLITTARTDENGQYTTDRIVSGTYTVHVTADGYTGYSRKTVYIGYPYEKVTWSAYLRK